MTDRAELARLPTPGDLDHRVEPAGGVRDGEWLERRLGVAVASEVLLERLPVDDDGALARNEPDPGDARLAAAGALEVRHGLHLALFHRERLGLLGLVRVHGPGVHEELARHLLAEAVLREHPPDRAAHDLFRPPREQPLEGLGLEATRVAGMADVQLVGELLPGHLDLRGVHDDDRITGVEVRRERRLVLAAERRRGLRGETAEHRTVRVDDAPVPLDLADLRALGLSRYRGHSLLASVFRSLRTPRSPDRVPAPARSVRPARDPSIARSRRTARRRSCRVPPRAGSPRSRGPSLAGTRRPRPRTGAARPHGSTPPCAPFGRRPRRSRTPRSRCVR